VIFFWKSYCCPCHSSHDQVIWCSTIFYFFENPCCFPCHPMFHCLFIFLRICDIQSRSSVIYYINVILYTNQSNLWLRYWLHLLWWHQM
jgi:hypothetical protein